MCLGIPLKLVEINENEGIGELNGVRRQIRLDLLNDLKIGDYLMVHAGFAIEKLDEAFAKETIEIAQELEKVLEEE